jgi:hypothetical protein
LALSEIHFNGCLQPGWQLQRLPKKFRTELFGQIGSSAVSCAGKKKKPHLLVLQFFQLQRLDRGSLASVSPSIAIFACCSTRSSHQAGARQTRLDREHRNGARTVFN